MKRLGAETVTDPLWEGKPNLSRPYWRIHGWHSERWIRLYSTDTLQELAKLAHVYSPRFISFAHSQREIQMVKFAQLSSLLLH